MYSRLYIEILGMRIENRVRKYRRQQNLTQQDLAKAVGVTRQTIIAVEKGNYAPSVGLALRLGAILNVRIEELFWLDEANGAES